MTLQYHHRLKELLGYEPKVSDKNLQQIKILEQFHLIKLPAAVHELFSLENYKSLLNAYDAHPIEIEHFYFDTAHMTNHDPRWQLAKFKPPRLFAPRGYVDGNYFIFLHENQGVYNWSFMINMGDDPPIMVRETEPNKPYVPCALTFSDFVYARIFDCGTDNSKDGHTLFAITEPIDNHSLAYLASHLKQELTTRDISSHFTFRYSGDGIGVSIMQRIENPGQSDWNIFAASETKLTEICQLIWHIATLSTALDPFNDEIGQKVLDKLRNTNE